MATIKKGVLILTPFFSPNIGGVETHLDDLVKALPQYRLYVLTYSPLTTATPYQTYEKYQNVEIHRFPWFGRNLFHSLEKYPLFDFLYLTPYLLLRSFIWMLLNHQHLSLIHSHGFNAAFIGNILAKLFRKKHLTSTHAVYDHINGPVIKLVAATLNSTDHILCLSESSRRQLLSWGVNPSKTSLFRYWIDLSYFAPQDIKPKNFTVLYVGRLIRKKGIHLLLKSASEFPHINFHFVGTGPESKTITEYSQKFSNIKFFSPVPNHQILKYFHQSSVFCYPSVYQEGFGRSVIEAVACGIPVIASNLGGLPEALTSDIAILIKPTTKNLTQAIKKISTDKNLYHSLQKNCRSYALKNFSSKNIKLITKYY